MITLRDSIEIRTSPSQIFAWLARLPQEYVSWHPDHVAYRVLQGSILEIDSEIEAEEYLHGKLHSIRFRTTKVIPDRRIEFEVKGLGRGAFEAQECGDMVRFLAELEIGSDSPLLGPMFDLIFTRFFRQRIEAKRQHMAEESENLRAILESEPSLETCQVAA